MIRVAVAGVRGRMGGVARSAVEAAEDLEYVGGLARTAEPNAKIYTDVRELLTQTKPDVLVDFTTYPTTLDVAAAAVAAGVSPVVGASGWSEDDRDALAKLSQERKVGAMVVPNFAIGAALMMQFSEDAARHFASVEIVEMHHDQKKDRPSGTARLTAERIALERSGGEVPIHSVRLRGALAHQEVLFSNAGEILTIRHDSLSRESFVPGILAAIRAVRKLPGLAIGLDAILENSK
jgi:4-hydroxy-tetrahydrodipicolinate reductase